MSLLSLNLKSLASEAFCLDSIIQDKSKLLQPSLDSVLTYKNQHIVDGLMSGLDIDLKIAEQLFEDGLIWLWYCNNHRSEGCRTIDDPILILDEVWHTFILYTPFYVKFCQTYFGDYLHHMPTLLDHDNSLPKHDQAHYLKRKKVQLETIFELLGRDVFIRWYHEYPVIFDRKKILKLRKK